MNDMRNMKCIYIALILILISAIFLSSCAGQEKQNITGKYVDKTNPNNYLVLNEDGTYYQGASKIMIAPGTYKVAGSVIEFHLGPNVTKGNIQGDNITVSGLNFQRQQE